jgi:hypothetical protein
MPVWGVARRLRVVQQQRTVSTDQAREPVIVEGHAELVVDRTRLAELLAAENIKYATNYGPELLDPEVNAAFRIVPHWAFGLTEADFSGSPTKWIFDNA